MDTVVMTTEIQVMGRFEALSLVPKGRSSSGQPCLELGSATSSGPSCLHVRGVRCLDFLVRFFSFPSWA